MRLSGKRKTHAQNGRKIAEYYWKRQRVHKTHIYIIYTVYPTRPATERGRYSNLCGRGKGSNTVLLLHPCPPSLPLPHTALFSPVLGGWLCERHTTWRGLAGPVCVRPYGPISLCRRVLSIPPSGWKPQEKAGSEQIWRNIVVIFMKINSVGKFCVCELGKLRKGQAIESALTLTKEWERERGERAPPPGYTALAGQLHENYKRLPGYAALAAQLHDSWLATG